MNDEFHKVGKYNFLSNGIFFRVSQNIYIYMQSSPYAKFAECDNSKIICHFP